MQLDDQSGAYLALLYTAQSRLKGLNITQWL